MMKFKAMAGRYRIEAVYTALTYGGVLEGRPSNQSIVEGIVSTTKKMWGERQILIKTTATTEPLPKWTHAAWVTGPEIDKGADGSELVIVWFNNDGPGADEAVSGVDWKTTAKDFWY